MASLARKILFWTLTVFSSLPAGAQVTNYFRPEPHDVGMFGGGAFYLGDLTDNSSLFRNLSFFVGSLYRYHFNDRYALRGGLAFGELRGIMLRPDMPEHRPPPTAGDTWDFHRSMIFMETVAEIGFLPLAPADFRKNRRWSPYLAGGIGFASFAPDKYIFVETEEMQTNCVFITLGVGIKYVMMERITISAEWLMRKTFSDGIDYYKGKAGSWAMNKDWIGTVGITLAYRLDEDRCCAAYNRHEPQIFPLKGKRRE
jgi:opacity protein-like surface antigen